MNKKWKSGVSFLLRSWVLSMLIAILIATSFKSAIADWNVVPTGSMKPTIVEGDRIFVNKLAYDLKIPFTTWRLFTWDNPARGDIVVFYSPADDTRLVKRVIGLPGDSLVMRKNKLFINGNAIEYEPLSHSEIDTNSNSTGSGQLLFQEDLPGRSHPVMISLFRQSIISFGPIKVPENHYFMMGDNRDNSADSRYFGFVERKKIVGQANAVVISLDHDNYYKPRWDRVFSKLN
ncbi:signal peptidase I [Thermodesulfobacteriota bacterium]